MKTPVRRCGWAWGALLVALAGAATATPVPTRPFLRIETGMHTAAIKRIDTDAAGRFLVTGSHVRPCASGTWPAASCCGP